MQMLERILRPVVMGDCRPATCQTIELGNGICNPSRTGQNDTPAVDHVRAFRSKATGSIQRSQGVIVAFQCQVAGCKVPVTHMTVWGL
jgi:hypothetical protein